MSTMSTAIELLKTKPEYVEDIAKIIKYEVDNEKRWVSEYSGWEWGEVGVDPSHIKKLIIAGIVKLVYSSRSNKSYKLHNLDDAKKLVSVMQDETACKDDEVEERPKILQIPDDIFSVIVGFDDMKQQIVKSLKVEKPVHFLFVGPPASAKTIMLLELARIPGAYYILGGSASKSGLYELLFALKPSVLLIDEIEKVDNIKTLSVLLSLMETGIVSETKSSKTRHMVLNTRVFACANREGNLSPELLSRFVEYVMPTYSDKDYIEIAKIVLTTREGKTPEIAEYIAQKVLMVLRSHDIRTSVRVARMTNTKEDVDQTILVMRKYCSIGTVI